MTETPAETVPQLYRIGELAEKAGVSRQIVSTYCMYGLIAEKARTVGGQRLFDDSAIRRIQLIRDLKSRYTLRQIRETFIRDRL
jgi:DNA-binding transcriptional MerR regulator